MRVCARACVCFAINYESIILRLFFAYLNPSSHLQVGLFSAAFSSALTVALGAAITAQSLLSVALDKVTLVL